MTPYARIRRTFNGVTTEIRRSRRSLSNWPSYAQDVLASRGLHFWPSMPSHDSLRHVRTRDGIQVTYRRNRGDIQGIREVFLDEAYFLPDWLRPKTLVDLGANIGLVSSLLSKRYGVDRVIGLEPVPSNVTLARRNLADNNVQGEILQVAVGPQRGQVSFQASQSSNLGRVGPGSLKVEMITMYDVLSRLGTKIDLLKIDIEGGEDALLSGDTSWLAEVQAIAIEIHPALVDQETILFILEDHGFTLHRVPTPLGTEAQLFVRH